MTRRYPRQINKDIIINIGSTCDILSYEGFLYDIHGKKKRTTTSNGGKIITNKKETLNKYGEVWLIPQAIKPEIKS